jgi:DNA invertase Pin-like site-specific DNA recombinase
MGDVATPAKVPDRVPVRAAEYVRMSTDHQKYSTANQSDAIRAYAGIRDFTIVRTYADKGKAVSI